MIPWLVALALGSPPVGLATTRAAFPDWTVADTGRGFLVATPTPASNAPARAIIDAVITACQLDFVHALPAETWTAFVLPDRRAYRRFVAAHYPEATWSDRLAGGTYGFADAERRWIVVDHGPGPGTLAHEVAHPLVRADFPAVPLWLDEGFAGLFEHKRYVDGRLEALVNWRMRTLRARRDDVALDALMSADALAFWSRGDLMMAAARHLLVWLQERGWLVAFYRRFRDEPALDPTGRRHLEAVTDRALPELEAAWKAWIRSTRPPDR